MSSFAEHPESSKYTNPKLHDRLHTVFKYDEAKSMGFSHQHPSTNEMTSQNDYPEKADHARHPVMINCQSCNKLTMTDVEYEHGSASKAWCCLLLPFFCTGLCCFCLNSCKDARHSCSECGVQSGFNQSTLC